MVLVSVKVSNILVYLSKILNIIDIINIQRKARYLWILDNSKAKKFIKRENIYE